MRLVLLLLLAGCASSSGVQRTGTDSYTISTSASPGKGGIPAAKKAAFEEADAECRKRGQSLHAGTETGTSPTWTDGMAQFALTFRCV